MSETVGLEADFCVVGGGLAGLCAALAAARRGADVVLMHDRPTPGGNASGEIRMWICGAQGENLRETGIVEELLLENLARNPGAVPSLWDSVLYGALEYAPGVRLLLNTSCRALAMDGRRIRSVSGWQSTTYTHFEVAAPLFADCSGDSVLAPLSGAEFRHGREAAAEYGETIAPAAADRHTMGSSCLIQARELPAPCAYRPPAWARKFRAPDDLPAHRGYVLTGLENFWWIETGGLGDTIRDAERHRRELLELAFGLWDYFKNRAPDAERNARWELDWVGFLPGKRESRRYVGDYVLTQRDVEAGRRFDDDVAYGGWTMDDHHPAGFHYPGPPTHYHPVAAPYGIPYRSLYSRNVENLFCAGRNISASHAALSSTRVMATCAVLGQACGTAAALAAREKLTPRDVGRRRIGELQRRLLEDDCFLPGRRRAIPAVSRAARLEAANGSDPESLRDGFDRPDAAGDHAWRGAPGDHVEYRFPGPARITATRIVFDSDLNRPEKNIVALRALAQPRFAPPPTLVKDFDLDYLDGKGAWRPLAAVRDNWRRLVRLDFDVVASAVRLTLRATHGNAAIAVFSWDVGVPVPEPEHGPAPEADREPDRK